MYSSNLIERAEGCSAFLSALANTNRLVIMCHLVGEELPVGVIAKRVGLSQSALSQHLAKLRTMDLVDTRRDRQTIYYTCRSDQVKTLLATLDAMFPPDA